MASEDVLDDGLSGEGSGNPMEKKLLELLSRLDQSLSPELKARLNDMMKQYEELGDPEKEDFQENLKQQLNNRFVAAARSHYLSAISNTAIVVGCIAVILLLFVFFGYKLYKSLKEKERKRDEKKKLRQQKKKK